MSMNIIKVSIPNCRDPISYFKPENGICSNCHTKQILYHEVEPNDYSEIKNPTTACISCRFKNAYFNRYGHPCPNCVFYGFNPNEEDGLCGNGDCGSHWPDYVDGGYIPYRERQANQLQTILNILSDDWLNYFEKLSI